MLPYRLLKESLKMALLTGRDRTPANKEQMGELKGHILSLASIQKQTFIQPTLYCELGIQDLKCTALILRASIG